MSTHSALIRPDERGAARPPRRVGIVLGTRPEAIKQAPVVLALREVPGVVPVVISTGQHRDLVRELLAGFGIEPDVDLELMVSGQALTDLAGDAVRELGDAIRRQTLDLVVVQGDTTTALAGALAAFYERVPVAHLEAGLRTDDRFSPFPEEVNRRLITQLAELHLAPTADAAARLRAEGVAAGAVAMVGNTVVDALLATVRRDAPYAAAELRALERVDAGEVRLMLVTAHRRESWGAGIAGIADAVAAVVAEHPDVVALWPVHPNPLVADVVRGRLAGLPRVILTEPLPYADLVRAMAHATLVVTDSGGVQEEACSLGRPTLVTRDTTERPEGLAAGGLRLVGTDAAVIRREAHRLLSDQQAYERMVCRSLPFGDGRAAERAAAGITAFLADRTPAGIGGAA